MLKWTCLDFLTIPGERFSRQKQSMETQQIHVMIPQFSRLKRRAIFLFLVFVENTKQNNKNKEQQKQNDFENDGIKGLKEIDEFSRHTI